MQPISPYLIIIRFLSASFTAIMNGLPECSSRSSRSFSVLILRVPLDDHVADLVPRSLGDHESQVDLARLGAGPGHRSHLRLEKALRLVVFDELLPVFIEHLGVILAEQPQDRLSRADLDPQLSRSWRNGCRRS